MKTNKDDGGGSDKKFKNTVIAENITKTDNNRKSIRRYDFTEEVKIFIRSAIEEETRRAIIEYDNKLFANDSCYRMPGKWGNIRKKALKSFGIEEPIW